MLTGTNFKKWKQNTEFVMGIADLDLALRDTKCTEFTDASTEAEKEFFNKQHKSNRLCMMAIKRSI